MNGLAHSICKGKRHKKESLRILTEVTDTLSKLETVSASEIDFSNPEHPRAEVSRINPVSPYINRLFPGDLTVKEQQQNPRYPKRKPGIGKRRLPTLPLAQYHRRDEA